MAQNEKARAIAAVMAARTHRELAEDVVMMAALLGHEFEWDSSTIEGPAGTLSDITRDAKLPSMTDGTEEQDVDFWQKVMDISWEEWRNLRK